MTVEDYQAKFPAAPLLSETAKKMLADRKKAGDIQSPVTAPAASVPAAVAGAIGNYLHEIFDLGSVPAALTSASKPIPITVLPEIEGDYGSNMVPKVDKNYVFSIDLLKTVLMCLELNMPCLLWGHMGTGKTTIFSQACARTRRPTIRIQHTLNTEESHILGQYVYRDGETKWQPGWLAIAMRYGLVYIADEYDFAVPHVLSVYQPVLEGEALVIKDAPPEWRVVTPHPNFRFLATGNTNGTGDAFGIYQGTQLQNAANYERFAVVQRVTFMDNAIEKQILQAKTGVTAKDADNLVRFATMIRAECDKSSISTPITPRSLVNAAKTGLMKGDFKVGLTMSYVNRLSSVEAEVAKGIAQRVFG
jgi:cobaltochelatase CobS